VKLLGLPPLVLALVFDLDGTLYTNRDYAKFQESSQVARLARRLGLSQMEAQAALDGAREARRAQGLPKTSMARYFLGFGVDMATIIGWREEEIHPADWLAPDARLDATLALLGKRFRLALLTNNPRRIGVENLDALGVAGRFELVVGLDDSFESKPAKEPFLTVCARLGLDPSSCVSIGDREDVDLATALDLGMGAVLVEGVEDVYRLPELFS
jgi:FMN phosphatase YigB (HAD superfamily)